MCVLSILPLDYGHWGEVVPALPQKKRTTERIGRQLDNLEAEKILNLKFEI